MSVLSKKRQSKKQEIPICNEMVVLPLKDTVLLPYEHKKLMVGRSFSLKGVRKALLDRAEIICVLQHQRINAELVPNMEDIQSYGVIAKITSSEIESPEVVTINVVGVQRIKINSLKYNGEYLVSEYELLANQSFDFNLFQHTYLNQIRLLVNKNHLYETIFHLLKKPNRNNDLEILYTIANIIFTSTFDKNAHAIERKNILEISPEELGQYLIIEAKTQTRYVEYEEKLDNLVNMDVNKQNYELWLRKKAKIIQEELKESNEELDDIAKKINEQYLSPEALKVAKQQLKKLENLSPVNSEYYAIKNYLNLIVSLPWNNMKLLNKDLGVAAERLNESHYGLEKVKEQIITSLAVNAQNAESTPEIILLLGPPGVGKTSFCESIAKATNREFRRISLAGLSDSAKLIGQMRTYVNSLPGSPIQEMSRCSSKNILLQLDEVDKINRDYGRDPMRVLISLLDTTQNDKFVDAHLDIPFDFSKVQFILTANSVQNLMPELIDRIRIIEIAGYTKKEKIVIANKLLKKAAEHCKISTPKISSELMGYIIDCHTQESGVRSLNRILRNICEKITLNLLLKKPIPKLSRAYIDHIHPKIIVPTPPEQVGCAVGLAWTSNGGQLQLIESMVQKDAKITISGNVSNVLTESANVAFLLIQTLFPQKKHGAVLHLPSGSIPKDGPSAGITIFSALYSLFSNRRLSSNICFTGEITLSGQILAIGGLQEKVNAAVRNRMKLIVVPSSNSLNHIKIDKSLSIKKVSNINELVSVLQNHLQ